MFAVIPVPVHQPLRLRCARSRSQGLQACNADRGTQAPTAHTALSPQSLCGASHQPKKIVLL